MTVKNNETIIISDATQPLTLSDAYYKNSKISIDTTTLKPSVIKKNATVLGIKGTYEGSGTGGSAESGSMKFYECVTYFDGSAIPAHKDLSISNCNITAANGTYNIVNAKVSGTAQVWSNGIYTCGLDRNNSCWVINSIENGLDYNSSLYYYGIDNVPTTTGNGQTKQTAYLWSAKVDSQNPWKTVQFNTSTGNSNENYRTYFYVKLLAGKSYQIGMTSEESDYPDNKIILYDINGTDIIQDDHSFPTINGISCQDGFTYTPSKTDIYIIGAGAYSDDTGLTEVICYPAPESINETVMPWEITNWTKKNATTNVSVSAIDVAEIPATNQQVWTGKQAIQNDDGSWTVSNTHVANLPVIGYIPLEGQIYNENTTISVEALRKPTEIPINQDGLVFYTDFDNNYINRITGIEASHKGGNFENFMGLNCIKFARGYNSYLKSPEIFGDYVIWDHRNNFPGKDITFVSMISPLQNTSFWIPLVQLLDLYSADPYSQTGIGMHVKYRKYC